MSDLQDDDFTLPDGLDDAVSPALLPSTPASTRSSTPSDRQQSPQPEFFTDFETGTSGKVKGDERLRRCDFALKLTTLVEAGDLTGYYAEVTRELDLETRVCYFTTDSVSQRGKFIAQMNKSFGTGGGFTCSLSDQELTRFLQFIKRSQGSNIVIKKATTIVGKQADGDTWVLNSHLYVNSNGQTIDPSVSTFIWSPECLASRADKVSVTEITPRIVTPLSEDCLKEMVRLVMETMKHNATRALLLIGGAIMSCHYRQIVELFGGFPIVLACGPTETGKSTSLKVGLCLTGGQKHAFYSKGTTAYFLERSALSCLPFGIDDPNMATYAGRKQLDVGELVVDLYNGAKTANLRSGALQPCSVPIISTNNPPKDDPRYKSRCLLITFQSPAVGPRNSQERKARADLEAALMSSHYSAAVGWVVSQGRRLEGHLDDVHQLEAELQMMPAFDNRPRECIGWALLIYFTSQLLEAAERPDLKDSVLVCVQNMLGGSSSAGDPSKYDTIVIETMEDVLFSGKDKSLAERLVYMRTGCFVHKKEVFAVCLEDVTGLRHSINVIQLAITKGGFGSSSESKDFLDTSKSNGKNDGTIIRNVNGVRRRGIAVYVSKLPMPMRHELWKYTKPQTEVAAPSAGMPTPESGRDTTDDSSVYQAPDTPDTGVDLSHDNMPNTDMDLSPVATLDLTANSGAVATLDLTANSGVDLTSDAAKTGKDPLSEAATGVDLSHDNMPNTDMDLSPVATLDLTANSGAVATLDLTANSGVDLTSDAAKTGKDPLSEAATDLTGAMNPRKRQHVYNKEIVAAKRATRSNSKAPEWSRSILAKNPLVE